MPPSELAGGEISRYPAKMPFTLLRLALAGALLLAVAPTFAQSAPPVAAYTGPRYPGGPDSLRALVGRSMRHATPGLTGRALVQFELKPDGQPRNFSMVRPPDPLRRPLVDATAIALTYLEAHMPAWQPAPPDADAKTANKNTKINLTLDFGTPPTSLPYHYADQNPIFSGMVKLLQAQRGQYFERILADPAKLAQFQSSTKGLNQMIQILVRYPAEALRNQQQGIVYIYFEVDETGAIEHPEILGTAGTVLDAEVLRTVSTLPAATTPAQLQNRAVRVSYVVPLTFAIQ